jgi:hypothetical protein
MLHSGKLHLSLFYCETTIILYKRIRIDVVSQSTEAKNCKHQQNEFENNDIECETNKMFHVYITDFFKQH